MARWFRFRHFRSRLLVLVVGLIAAAQAGTFLLVNQAHHASARARIESDLARGARDFQRLVDQRVDSLGEDFFEKHVFLVRSKKQVARSQKEGHDGDSPILASDFWLLDSA